MIKAPDQLKLNEYYKKGVHTFPFTPTEYIVLNDTATVQITDSSQNIIKTEVLKDVYPDDLPKGIKKYFWTFDKGSSNLNFRSNYAKSVVGYRHKEILKLREITLHNHSKITISNNEWKRLIIL
jgi:hypothetical protein